MKYKLSIEEQKILDFLTLQRQFTDEYFSAPEIAKGADRFCNQSTYQMLYRLCRYDLVHHKIVNNRRMRFVSVFRRKL